MVRKRAPNSRMAKGRAALPRPQSVAAGVVGMGLMGRSIATCLVAAGHPVVGVTRSPSDRPVTRRRIHAFLRGMKREGLLAGDPSVVIKRL